MSEAAEEPAYLIFSLIRHVAFELFRFDSPIFLFYSLTATDLECFKNCFWFGICDPQRRSPACASTRSN